MFFGKIRSRLGWNNNPTALQFKWALRTLLQKNQITAPKTGNCINITETESQEKDFEPDQRIVQLLDTSPVWRNDVHTWLHWWLHCQAAHPSNQMR